MSSTIAGLRGRGRLWALSHCLTNFFALPTCFDGVGVPLAGVVVGHDLRGRGRRLGSFAPDVAAATSAATASRQVRAMAGGREARERTLGHPHAEFHGEPARAAAQGPREAPGSRRPRRSRAPSAAPCRCRPRPRAARPRRRTGTGRRPGARMRSRRGRVVGERQRGAFGNTRPTLATTRNRPDEHAGQARVRGHGHEQQRGSTSLHAHPGDRAAVRGRAPTGRPLTALMAMIPAALAPNTRLKLWARVRGSPGARTATPRCTRTSRRRRGRRTGRSPRSDGRRGARRNARPVAAIPPPMAALRWKGLGERERGDHEQGDPEPGQHDEDSAPVGHVQQLPAHDRGEDRCEPVHEHQHRAKKRARARPSGGRAQRPGASRSPPPPPFPGGAGPR